MKSLIKIYLLPFMLITVDYVYAEVKMNEHQIKIIEQLKKQSILPNKIYYQYDFMTAFENEDSVPMEHLFSSISDLETPPDMYELAIQSIAEVKLNKNYQYNEVLQRNRNIIEVIYPTDSFQSLNDGVYFYTLDKNKQLQKKDSFNEVYKLPCYLRVEKKHGIVVSIQKRPLAAISHYKYDYWPNNSLKYLKIEMTDNNDKIIYISETFFNDYGRIEKNIRKNTITGNLAIESIQHHGDVYSIEEYFNNKNIKTNRVIHYENSFRVKNEILNKSGKVIKINNINPLLFDFEKDLDEPYPYNKLVVNLEKSITQLVSLIGKLESK